MLRRGWVGVCSGWAGWEEHCWGPSLGLLAAWVAPTKDHSLPSTHQTACAGVHRWCVVCMPQYWHWCACVCSVVWQVCVLCSCVAVVVCAVSSVGDCGWSGKAYECLYVCIYEHMWLYAPHICACNNGMCTVLVLVSACGTCVWLCL